MRHLDNLTIAFIAREFPTVGLALCTCDGVAVFTFHARCAGAFLEGETMQDGDEITLYEGDDNDPCWQCNTPLTLPSTELRERLRENGYAD